MFSFHFDMFHCFVNRVTQRIGQYFPVGPIGSVRLSLSSQAIENIFCFLGVRDIEASQQVIEFALIVMCGSNRSSILICLLLLLCLPVDL